MRDEEDFMSQRSLAGGPVFRFHDRYLEYCGIDRDFKVKYQDMVGPSQYRRGRSSNLPKKLAFFYLILFALVMVYRDPGPHYGPEGWHWLLRSAGVFFAVLVAVGVLLHYLTHREYTVVPCRSGNVLIVRDKRHDAIVQRLQAERLKALRLLSAPDPANSPEEEAAKLKWLREEGAISEDEYQHLHAQEAA